MQDVRISKFCPLLGRTGAGFAYDDAHNDFLMMPSNGSILTRFKENAGVSFDPRNVGNKECLYMGIGRSGRILLPTVGGDDQVVSSNERMMVVNPQAK